MAHAFTLTRRVEFSETDAAGIMHFANFFRFMESAEHAFFRSLGLSILPADGAIGWPRVHADCDYSAPLRFEDVVEVHLRVRERRTKSLAYDFVFTRIEPGPRQEVARGSLVVVCVAHDAATGGMSAVPIPPDIASRIEPAPAPAP